MGYEVKTRSELGFMREAGQVVAETLRLLTEAAVPGTTLAELDRLARAEISRQKAVSSFLGYKPGSLPAYPAVLCSSVNSIVVHGIPDGTVLEEGDILSLDFGVMVRFVIMAHLMKVFATTGFLEGRPP